jgi:lipopolysaccharide transport system ATP-binding protein
MSSKITTAPSAFRLHDVSKSYTVYAHPLDRLKELFSTRPRHRLFTALHSLNLEIPQGSSLGIIGDNGAGKSTLMHLLAGTHTPTSGQIERHGRVLGLLELGVGFHPEFSGRDNLYFQGDILGIERRFIQARMDDILRFAEIGEFIDQPLRTYSTGMRVRLAFALIASLDPDTLIVDEALAVGDIHFQKKCIDRMSAFKQAGKTIIFCSHSLYQVGQFCEQVLWMQHGKMRMYGAAEEVLPAYEAYQLAKDEVPDVLAGVLTGKAEHSAPARITHFLLTSPSPMNEGDELCVEFSTQTADNTTRYHASLSIKLESGRGVFVAASHLRGDPPLQGSQTQRIRFPKLPLMGGSYQLHLRLWDDQGLMIYDERLLNDLTIRKQGREMGIVRLEQQWEVVPIAPAS